MSAKTITVVATFQAKPGKEHQLAPAPMYDAPYYEGSRKLAGKVKPALRTAGLDCSRHNSAD